jgi:hypothetical protein
MDTSDKQEFVTGDPVKKMDGYKYPGVVVAAFQTTRGHWRYVVECTTPSVRGMLHIFSGKQLRHNRR